MIYIRYNRISSNSQKLDRQKNRLLKNEQEFNDICSGSIAFSRREKGREIIELIKNNKVESMRVSSIDRLGRSLKDIILTIEFLTEHKVNLIVDNLGISSMINAKKNSTFILIATCLSQVYEMEREMMLERQREGIAIRKAKGLYRGRIKGSVESDETFLNKYSSVTKLLKQGFSVRKTAKLCDVSQSTVQKVKRKMTT